MHATYLDRASVTGENKGRNARSELVVTTSSKYTLQHEHSTDSNTANARIFPYTIPDTVRPMPATDIDRATVTGQKGS
jgi:hypothetical protein